jgi:hypothetical protein
MALLSTSLASRRSRNSLMSRCPSHSGSSCQEPSLSGRRRWYQLKADTELRRVLDDMLR